MRALQDTYAAPATKLTGTSPSVLPVQGEGYSRASSPLGCMQVPRAKSLERACLARKAGTPQNVTL